jgi:hypothetical protein
MGHFALMVVGLVVLAAINRAVTPSTLWVHWVLLGWSALFVAHLSRFEKGTMATMGRSSEPSAADSPPAAPDA